MKQTAQESLPKVRSQIINNRTTVLTCLTIVAGGKGVGKPGNKCHIDCSNRGICNHKTGVCSCFAGYLGDNCNTLSPYVTIHDRAKPR